MEALVNSNTIQNIFIIYTLNQIVMVQHIQNIKVSFLVQAAEIMICCEKEHCKRTTNAAEMFELFNIQSPLLTIILAK